MAIKFQHVRELGQHPMIARPREIYRRHHYSTPLFVLRETVNAFRLHNGLSISASLSFYAMFALIPMALLMFFLLSHLVISSDYAIVKLAILTSNLVPKFSSRIMVEVYNVTSHQAVWGIFGILALLWIVTPLASALRSAFYTIATMIEAPSYIRRKLKDIVAVIGILLLFFLFTFSGLMLEKIVLFLKPLASHTALINSLGSFALTTLLMATFYRIFFPARTALQHIFIGSLVTAVLWLAMRPAFALFLSVNESYGSMFGSMKNMFISIVWLYYTFAIFLLGTELIATLRRKDVLLLRGLFGDMPGDKANYLRELMARFGKTFNRGDYVFRRGEQGRNLYYVVAGSVALIEGERVARRLEEGDYFGEISLLTETDRAADARIESETAQIVVISGENIETLLLGDPKITMRFLRQMAARLQSSHQPSFD